MFRELSSSGSERRLVVGNDDTAWPECLHAMTQFIQQTHRSTASLLLLSVTVRFRSSLPGLGTPYQTKSRQRLPSRHSVLR